MKKILLKLSRTTAYFKLAISDFQEMIRYFSSGNCRSMFNLKAYQLGFADHRSKNKESFRDWEIMKRLIQAYRKAKEDERSATEPYQLRGEWEHIIGMEYARLVSVLQSEDAKELAALLQNFCRNECSRGLSMSSELLVNRRRPFYKFRYINEFNEDFENSKMARHDTFDPGVLCFPFIGNPVGMLVDGNLIPAVNIRHRYYAQRLLELLPNRETTVAEIGGGFGGLAYFLLKESKTPIRYINFDLPEINVVNSYFLLKTFPDRKILLYGEEAKTLPEALGKAAVIIYPHFCFHQLPDQSMDMVFNSNSLTEMDEQMVLEYYAQINRVCRGYFMHVNHDDEKVYDKSRNKKHVKISKYSLPGRSFREIYTLKPSFFNAKYYEYLYQAVQ